ncbi:hypothetical protein [Pseudomonas phage vB_PsaM_M1]|nr:hypothetical protein [Pseudomonas phage vB_PsaM_M1]
MKTDPVHCYYKDPATGVEMSFSKRSDFGWAVSFPNAKTKEEISAALHFKNIPWPTLSAEEQAVVDENYKKLHKMMEEDDET